MSKDGNQWKYLVCFADLRELFLRLFFLLRVFVLIHYYTERRREKERMRARRGEGGGGRGGGGASYRMPLKCKLSICLLDLFL